MDHQEHEHHLAKSPHDDHGVNKHEGPSCAEATTGEHHTQDFLKKFWITLALTIPILAYSEIAKTLFFWQAPRFFGYEYVILFLASIVFFYGGWVFIIGAYHELKARLPGMMTLIALAITASYSFSVFSVLSGMGENLFWELSTLIAIMLLGHWIEMKAVQGAQGALKELAKLLPDTAEVLRPPKSGEAGNGKTQIIPISNLTAGDIILVRPGSKMPADGVIIDGQSDLNEAIITGESKPIEKKIGDRVIAGSINGDGALKVRVDKIGEATFLAGVTRLVAQAQMSKSRLQTLSDRAALYLTVIAIASGLITFISWFVSGAGIVMSVERLVAVLVITCPHALGLAVPLVASISTKMAAQNGILVKQRLSLEAAREINMVLFDKTGTLTKGEFGVDGIVAVVGIAEEQVLKMAASVNSQSEHPLAKGMAARAKKQNIVLDGAKDFKRMAGKGAMANINGEIILAGNMALMDDFSVAIPNDVKTKISILENQGKTIVFVASGNNLIGAIAMADAIRQESREAVAMLKAAGISVSMITGDSKDVAKWVAKELGIDQYFAKVLPNEKSQKLKALQEKGFKVAMVGDGINDAPALAQADLGIAIGAGTNVAIESAGIILVKNDPRDIVKIIRLSQLTYVKMAQNLFWATGYNLIALPLAAGVMASKGIILDPAIAAIFMSASTVIVAVNAAMLRWQKF